MKKLLVILFVTSLFIFTACSNDEDTDVEAVDGTEDGTEDSTETESGEAVTLDIFSWRTGDTEEFDEIISAFNEDYPDIHINFDPTTAPEYDSALNTQLSTGTAADIFFVRPFALGENIYDAGHLEVLTEADIENLTAINDIQKEIYSSGETGELYAMPFNFVSYGFLYNKTMFEENGWDEPETWEEFYALLDDIQQEGITPLALGTADDWVIDEIVGSGFYPSFVGGEPWREELLAGENSLTDPAYIDFLENLTQWTEYMPENMEGIGYVDALQMFMAENAAIWVTGSWALTDLDQDEITFDIDMFASPVKNSGDQRWVGFNGGAGLGINAQSEHQEEAKIFLNWLMSEEAQALTLNLLPGQFPPGDIPVDQIEDPTNRKWLEVGGENDENYAVGLAFEGLNAGDPTMGTLQMENISQVLQGNLSPKEAAENMQEGLSSWYEPFQ